MPWPCERENWQGALQIYTPTATPETFVAPWRALPLSYNFTPQVLVTPLNFPFHLLFSLYSALPEWTQQSLSLPFPLYLMAAFFISLPAEPKSNEE